MLHQFISLTLWLVFVTQMYSKIENNISEKQKWRVTECQTQKRHIQSPALLLGFLFEFCNFALFLLHIISLKYSLQICHHPHSSGSVYGGRVFELQQSLQFRGCEVAAANINANYISSTWKSTSALPVHRDQGAALSVVNSHPAEVMWGEGVQDVFLLFFFFSWNELHQCIHGKQRWTRQTA